MAYSIARNNISNSCNDGEIITGMIFKMNKQDNSGYVRELSEIVCYNVSSGSSRNVETAFKVTEKDGVETEQITVTCSQGFKGIKFNQFLPDGVGNMVITNGVQTLSLECLDPSDDYGYLQKVISDTGYQLRTFTCPNNQVLKNFYGVAAIPNPTTIPPPISVVPFDKNFSILEITTSKLECVSKNSGIGDNNSNNNSNNNNNGTNSNPPKKNNMTRNITIIVVIIIIIVIIIVVLLFRR